MWARYFVTCAICRLSFSRHGSGATFCPECKCHVCGSCDCTVFHLAYQVCLSPFISMINSVRFVERAGVKHVIFRTVICFYKDLPFIYNVMHATLSKIFPFANMVRLVEMNAGRFKGRSIDETWIESVDIGCPVHHRRCFAPVYRISFGKKWKAGKGRESRPNKRQRKTRR